LESDADKHDTEKKEFAKKESALISKIQGGEVENFIAKNDKLISKSMVPYVTTLLGEDKKEYTLDKKNFSKQELLHDLLKLSQESVVNLESNSTEGDKAEGANSEDVLNQKIEKYSAEHKVSYSDAYIAVSGQEKAKGKS